MSKKKGKRIKSLKSLFTEKKNISFIAVTAGVLALFAFFGVTMVNQGADISRMEKQKEEVSRKLEVQNQANDELKSVLDSDDKNDYIEQKAREKGYVKSNEIVFYDISASE